MTLMRDLRQELPRALPPLPKGARLLVDATHLGRHVTGIERITEELFRAEALAPLPVEHARAPAGGMAGMLAGQQLLLPWRLARASAALLLCPGFPPPLAVSTFMAERVVPYVHDLFLLTRKSELSWKARAYMAPAFRLMLRRARYFLANSRTTARQLRRHCRSDAVIRLYRPEVRNVFGARARLDARAPRDGGEEGPRLLSIGTLEPRKNHEAAARIVHELRMLGLRGARLDIVGREGWGGVARRLRGVEGVRLHGYLPAPRVRALLEEADVLVCASTAEGLGLPLLEAQHAGVPVVAPDGEVFREVLGDSGLLVDVGKPRHAARAIAAMLTDTEGMSRWRRMTLRNVARWNRQARADRLAVIDWLHGLLAGTREAGACC